MKTLLAVLTLVISTSAFADTFSDRQEALNRHSDQQTYAAAHKAPIEFNRKYLRFLSAYIAKHKGARGEVACQTRRAAYVTIYKSEYSQPETVGTTQFSGSKYSVSLQYTNSDLEQTVINEDTSARFVVPVQPQLSSCAFDLRDGLACQAGLEDADRPNDLVGDNLFVTCIGKSLNKSHTKLGPMF